MIFYLHFFLDAKFVNENSPSCHISSNIFARIQVISPTNVDIQAAPKPFRNYQIYSRTPGKVYYKQAERYISCNIISYDFYYTYILSHEIYYRCHQTDKPYKCNSCYKCFVDETALLEHIPKHKESKHLKTHICQYCGKSYTQVRRINRYTPYHMTIFLTEIKR